MDTSTSREYRGDLALTAIVNERTRQRADVDEQYERDTEEIDWSLLLSQANEKVGTAALALRDREESEDFRAQAVKHYAFHLVQTAAIAVAALEEWQRVHGDIPRVQNCPMSGEPFGENANAIIAGVIATAQQKGLEELTLHTGCPKCGTVLELELTAGFYPDHVDVL